MTSLREQAAVLAGRVDPQPADEPAGEGVWAPPAQLAEPDIAEPDPAGPERVPVHVAWSRVMGTVRSIGKHERVTEGPARFAYRGVDAALMAFGPACRLHGVLVLPVRVEASYRDTKTSLGKPTRECTVLVTYRIVGPTGDHLEVQAAGESLDTQDKGTAKAQAVALRTLLYHAGLVPTGDPDPDQQTIERGEAPVRLPQDYRDEALDPDTSRARMVQIHHEIGQHRIVGAMVINEHGEEEALGALVLRAGRERFGGES